MTFLTSSTILARTMKFGQPLTEPAAQADQVAPLTDSIRSQTLPALTPSTSSSDLEARRGAAAAFVAYFLWGTLPVYWKLLEDVALDELMAHRVIWTLAAVVGFQAARGRLDALRQTWLVPANRRAHLRGGMLVTANWGIFVWALLNEQVIEASLGYFLVPLASAAIGRYLFREHLDRLQQIALGLAPVGVALLFSRIENPPWVAIGIAASWCSYGVSRKRSDASAINGLGLELGFVAPAALLYLGWLSYRGLNTFGTGSPLTDLTIAGTGIISMMPLVLFAFATRRLTYTTLGLLQYVAPSCQFLIGWLVFGEPFAGVRVIGFVLIWTALICYTYGTLRLRVITPGGL